MSAARIVGGIGSSLGTLGNIALTWEGRAAKIAGRFGMVGSLVCGFLEMLIPPAEQPPPLTKQDLTAALNQLYTEVIQALWLQEATNVRNGINAFNDDFQKKWTDLTKIKLSPVKDSAGKVVGSRPIIDDTDELTPASLSALETYYLPSGQAAAKLDKYRQTLQNPTFNDTNLSAADLARRQNLTLQLYVLVGSLNVAYCQASIAWRWGKEMLLANQVTAYNTDHDNWAAQCDANPKYATQHPEADLLDPYPELKLKIAGDANFLTKYKPRLWQDWAQESGCPVQDLKDTVDALLAYCVTGLAGKPGVYTDLRQRWDALDTAVAHPDPAIGAMLNVPAGGKVTIMQLTLAMTEARDRAATWSTTVVSSNLQGVEEDDVITFGQAIDAWRTLRAAVSFRYYTTVTATETLTSVATDQYGDASLAPQIAKYNADVKQGVNDALPLGTELKIFDQAWLPYVDLAKELWPRPTLTPHAN